MGRFSDLMGSILGGGKVKAPEDASSTGAPESKVQAARRQGVPVGQAVPGNATGVPSVTNTPASKVDVEARLDKMAAENKQKLDWRHSIVDLMKLVGMDSSLSARKDLADDLNYQGDKSDSATMNMWLHKEVMRKLAENGGKVPADLQ
jgi:hypothetical protein